MKKVAFFEVEKWEQNYISGKMKGCKCLFFNGELTLNNVKKVKDCEAVSVFIYSKVNEHILSRLPKLKILNTMSTGFDHIDLDYCKKKGIKVTNVPFYGENTVAEYAFALILSLSRKIPEATAKTRKGDFDIDGLIGFDLKGKTIGVVGPGHIGQHVIKIAKAFDMNVLAYGRKKDLKLARKMGFKFVSLDKLFASSDIITLHVPLCDATRNMINMNNVKKIKKGAYLINIARGGLVDTTALLYGLDKGIIAGAGVDVLEEESDVKEERELLKKGFTAGRDYRTLIENHVLLKDERVIVTPHSAFYTREALQRIFDISMGNVKGFFAGKKVYFVEG
jgi:D-lactate dehydrogenase